MKTILTLTLIILIIFNIRPYQYWINKIQNKIQNKIKQWGY
jgi:hypothetical protein